MLKYIKISNLVGFYPHDNWISFLYVLFYQPVNLSTSNFSPSYEWWMVYITNSIITHHEHNLLVLWDMLGRNSSIFIDSQIRFMFVHFFTFYYVFQYECNQKVGHLLFWSVLIRKFYRYQYTFTSLSHKMKITLTNERNWQKYIIPG